MEFLERAAPGWSLQTNVCLQWVDILFAVIQGFTAFKVAMDMMAYTSPASKTSRGSENSSKHPAPPGVMCQGSLAIQSVFCP